MATAVCPLQLDPFALFANGLCVRQAPADCFNVDDPGPGVLPCAHQVLAAKGGTHVALRAGQLTIGWVWPSSRDVVGIAINSGSHIGRRRLRTREADRSRLKASCPRIGRNDRPQGVQPRPRLRARPSGRMRPGPLYCVCCSPFLMASSSPECLLRIWRTSSVRSGIDPVSFPRAEMPTMISSIPLPPREPPPPICSQSSAGARRALHQSRSRGSGIPAGSRR